MHDAAHVLMFGMFVFAALWYSQLPKCEYDALDYSFVGWAFGVIVMGAMYYYALARAGWLTGELLTWLSCR